MSCNFSYYDTCYKCYFSDKPCIFSQPDFEACQKMIGQNNISSENERLGEILTDLRILFARYLHRSDDSNVEVSQAYYRVANDIENLINKYEQGR